MLAPPKPPQDDPELLIKEARARRRRRQLLTAGGVAIATAFGLVVYALAGGVDSRSATGGSARDGAPPCRGAQLATIAEGGQGGGAGNGGASVQIADTSGHACVLPVGQPSMTFTFDGKPVPVKEQIMPPPYTAFGPRAGRVLVPGREVMYVANWGSATCRKAFTTPRGTPALVTLRFGNGLRLVTPERTPEDIPILPRCPGEPPQAVDVTPLLRVPT